MTTDSKDQIVIPRRDISQALSVPDDLLHRMCDSWSPDTLEKIPGLRYWDVQSEDRFYASPTNLVGHQQRAFDFYWSVKLGVERGGCCLGVGTAGVNGPATLGTDKYPGTDPCFMPHMLWCPDAEESPFLPASFEGLLLNHVFEHFEDQEQTLRGLMRLLRIEGCLCMILPDMAFLQRGETDPTHTREFAAQEFYDWLEGDRTGCVYDIIEFNTLDNHFSFNVVLRRLA